MEPITLSNINLNGALDPSRGFFMAEMLRAALGLLTITQIYTGVRIGSIPAPDFKPDAGNPVTWMWKPSTVQSLMTDAAAASVRSAVTAWEIANPGVIGG